eukprot:COSAG02_NODE_3634_length_6446_cov_3.541201_2_plen_95_part_00
MKRHIAHDIHQCRVALRQFSLANEVRIEVFVAPPFVCPKLFRVVLLRNLVQNAVTMILKLLLYSGKMATNPELLQKQVFDLFDRGEAGGGGGRY